jgi:hypothetical protein
MMAVQHLKIPKNTTNAEKLYRYVIDHDMGFSPNPFHGYCTLADCKPIIRRCARVGDFVMGFGPAKSSIRYRLIYWMRVDEIVTFDQYWLDDRFRLKKPVLNGSHLKFHGDNIYHRGPNGVFIQAPSFHSLPDGNTNYLNLNTDTGTTDRVLISQTFGYYGAKAIAVPDCLHDAVATGRGHRTRLSPLVQSKVLEWLLSDLQRGFAGEPSDWQEIKKWKM